MADAATTCPSCGEPLPAELGQHALTPVSGLVQCPSCGADVTLAKPGETADMPLAEEAEPGVSGEPDSFSGEETLEGVMDELAEKPGGPGGDE